MFLYHECQIYQSSLKTCHRYMTKCAATMSIGLSFTTVEQWGGNMKVE